MELSATMAVCLPCVGGAGERVSVFAHWTWCLLVLACVLVYCSPLMLPLRLR